MKVAVKTSKVSLAPHFRKSDQIKNIFLQSHSPYPMLNRALLPSCGSHFPPPNFSCNYSTGLFSSLVDYIHKIVSNYETVPTSDPDESVFPEVSDPKIIQLLKPYDSIWLTELELEKIINESFPCLHIRDVADACVVLKRAYIDEGDNKSGYYLLWLIKYSAGCDSEMPSKDTFDKSTVRTFVTKWLSGGLHTLKHEKNYIELLYFRGSSQDSFIFQDFVEPHCHRDHFYLALDLLNQEPISSWPCKGSFIVRMLEAVSMATEQFDDITRIMIAVALKNSFDKETSELGHTIYDALTSDHLGNTMDLHYRLILLDPGFKYSNINLFFSSFRDEFRHELYYDIRTPVMRIHKPVFQKWEFLNKNQVIFKIGDLIIAVRDPYVQSYFDFENKYRILTQPHLLAYNMNTKNLEWGFPLDYLPVEELSSGLNIGRPPMNSSFDKSFISINKFSFDNNYRLDLVDNDIMLKIKGAKKVYFIDSSSGKVKKSIEFPYEILSADFGWIHLTPNGFGFQMHFRKDSRSIIGGKISNSKLNPMFEVDVPAGGFLPLSTHVGIFCPLDNKLIVYNPNGKSVILDCHMPKAYGDKLYLIEEHPILKNRYNLTVRALKADDSVVSTPEKTIMIKADEEVSIDFLCEDGKLILTERKCHLDKSKDVYPIIVDIDCEEVIYFEDDLESFGNKVFKTSNGELWSWDPVRKEVWNTSSEVDYNEHRKSLAYFFGQKIFTEKECENLTEWEI